MKEASACNEYDATSAAELKQPGEQYSTAMLTFTTSGANPAKIQQADIEFARTWEAIACGAAIGTPLVRPIQAMGGNLRDDSDFAGGDAVTEICSGGVQEEMSVAKTGKELLQAARKDQPEAERHSRSRTAGQTRHATPDT